MKMFTGRKGGVSFEQYCQWIAYVKAGKRAIIHGPAFVVMSRNIYEELTKPPELKVFIDEEHPPSP